MVLSRHAGAIGDRRDRRSTVGETRSLAIGDVLSLRLVPPLTTDARGTFPSVRTDSAGISLRMMLAWRLSLAVGVIGSVWRPRLERSSARSLRGAAGSPMAPRWRSRTPCWLSRAWCCSCMLSALAAGLTTVVVVLIRWLDGVRVSSAARCSVRAQPYVDAAWRSALGRGVLLRRALPGALGPAIVATTGRRQRDSFERTRSWARRSTAQPVGEHDCRRTRFDRLRTVGRDCAWTGAHRDGAGVHASGGQSSRSNCR